MIGKFTRDGLPSAQWEIMVLVSEDGKCEVPLLVNKERDYAEKL